MIKYIIAGGLKINGTNRVTKFLSRMTALRRLLLTYQQALVFTGSLLTLVRITSKSRRWRRYTNLGRWTIYGVESAGYIWEGYTTGTTEPTSTIGAAGSATFAGNVKVGGNTNFVNIKADGGITAIDQANNQHVWINNSSPGAIIVNDVNSSTNAKIVLNADGSATFAGFITANGTILTRASGDLDVGERLEKADNALQALKTAVATATDFTTLKAAIISSLQEV